MYQCTHNIVYTDIISGNIYIHTHDLTYVYVSVYVKKGVYVSFYSIVARCILITEVINDKYESIFFP